MIKKNVVTQEGFDALLDWLDRNRETAGEKYEKIRQRLIRVFVGRGCYEAEELTDETINRVTLKLPHVIKNYVGEPTLYFYGVANNIHREWLRKQKSVKFPQISDVETTSEANLEYKCLETCLETLPARQRRLIIDYYREDKKAKIEHRKKLAKKLGIGTNALQIKTCRIRSVLLECVRECVARKN
jgi:DNA-directed RNA polymerase specialized sigma24 family protein